MRALLLLFFAAALGAQMRVQTGEIDGAKFRIDIPQNWNHGLVMYCHGYSPEPGHFDEKPARDVFSGSLWAGYSIAQSSAPMLAIHTTYDPIVPSSAPDSYATRVRAAGNPGLFVQQYVEHDGHCAIRPEEVASGFSEVLRWGETGSAPGFGPVPVSSSQTR